METNPHMNSMIKKIRITTPNKILGFLRIFIGIILLSTGVMKFLVPMLWNAWSGQLQNANIPFYEFNLIFVPIAEIITGLQLISGFYSRIGSLIIIVFMTVATYTHLVVDNPDLFPLQPKEPIIPLLLIVIGFYVFWKGGGEYSLDLKYTDTHLISNK